MDIPHAVKDNFVYDFIRGYFEGDGSIFLLNSSNNWCVSISGEIDFLHNIQESLNMGKIYKDRSIGKLSIAGNNNVEKFISTIYYDDTLISAKGDYYKCHKNKK